MIRKFFLLGILLLLLVSSASAQHDVFHKTGKKGSVIDVVSDSTSIEYTDPSGVSINHTIYIDGSKMAVNFNSQSSTREIWGTGNGLGNSDVLVQHDFDGTANDTLKGTITIKTPHVITFPYTLSSKANITNSDNGGLKVVEGPADDYNSRYLPGVVILAPTAINNTGGSVPVWYTFDSEKITLNINDAGQEYPITIDPTFFPEIPLGYSNVTSFTYNITTGMGTQTDYQMKFILSNLSGVSGYYSPDNIIYTNGTTLPTWYDVNATDGSGTPLPFWLENNTYTTYNATAWVRVPSVATDNTSTGKWYYGCSSANGSTMNGLNAFPLFDDFISSSRNVSKWNLISTPTVTYDSGYLIMATSATSTDQGYTSNGTTFGINYSVLSRMKTNATSGTFTPAMGFSNDTYKARIYKASGGSWTAYADNAGLTSTQAVAVADTSYHLLGIKRNGTASIVGSVDTTAAAITTNVPSPDIPILLREYSSSGTAIMTLDWVFVRKSVWVEPTTSLYSTSTTGGTPVSPPVAAFSCTPVTVTLGTPIVCTDASTNFPTNWSWEFGDGNTSILQNPTYTYPFTGVFGINMSANNTVGLDWENKTEYINVTNVSGLVHQDVFLESQKTLTLNFKSSTTGEMIPVVQVYNQVDATTTNTTNGTFIGTYSFGTQAFIFHSEGYVSRTGSYYVDDNVEYTVQMVPVAPSSNPNTNIIYSPRLVRFRAVDKWHNPLTPVNITASYIADTLPNNDPTYLQNAFGVSASVVSLMMNSSIAMSGVTGVDGSNTFSMFPALTYNITVTNATMGVSCQQNLAPADTDYVLYCPTSAQIAGTTPLSQTLNRSYIWITEPNASWVTINSSYQDPTGLTSNVLFNVSVVDNNTVIYSHDFGNPGTSQVLDNYTMPNIRGMQITSYLAYNRSTS